MMIRSSLFVVGAVLYGVSAYAQQQALPLQTHNGPVKHVRYDMRTRTITPIDKGMIGIGPDVIYNNTCLQTGVGYVPGAGVAGGAAPGAWSDWGQVPSTSNGDLPGCADSYLINGFNFGYCTDNPPLSIGIDVTIWESLGACPLLTDSGANPNTFVLTGLPGSTGGVQCWIIEVDLMGSSLEFTMQGDGDGSWDDVPDSDTFGATWSWTAVTGTSTGLIAPEGPIFGTISGCNFSVGTVFDDGAADYNGTAPEGTGWGNLDAFSIETAVGGNPFGAAGTGCFFLGGWPASGWSGFYLDLQTMDAGCPDSGTVKCIPFDGTHPPCPCGNNPSGQTGCENTLLSGIGGQLSKASGSNSISAQDLEFTAVNMPPNFGQAALLFTNSSSSFISPGLPAKDGVLCVGGGPRLQVALITPPGVYDTTNSLNGVNIFKEDADSGSPFYTAPGDYDWQLFYRDQNPIFTGRCVDPNGAANLSNAIQLTLTL